MQPARTTEPANHDGLPLQAQCMALLHGTVGGPHASTPACHDDNSFGPLAVETQHPPTSPPQLDDDAEDTALPPGLLDAEVDNNTDPPATSPVHLFLDSMTAPPPAPALPLPLTTPTEPDAAAAGNAQVAATPAPTLRSSARQRQASTSHAKTATQRAVEVQFKWMGLNDEQRNPNTEKKKQCLNKYTGPDRMTAQAALDDLFTGAGGATSK